MFVIPTVKVKEEDGLKTALPLASKVVTCTERKYVFFT